jgi:hypothetical protein
MSADAEVHDFTIGGLLHVAGVEATGYSRASGRPGGASTSAEVTVEGLTIGAATISVDRKGVRLGSSPPVPVSSAGPLVEQFNQSAASEGCNLTLLSNPPTYPQGTLFARPPLPDRVKADGSDAGSTAGGVVLRCVVPENLNPTNFKPLILQILLGFVGTEADASASAPQFGITGAGGPSYAGTTQSSGVAYAAGSASVGAAPPASTGTPGYPPSVPGAPPATTAVAPPVTAAAITHAGPTAVAGRLLGGLVPLRTGLEAGGLALAVLIGLLGVGLVAPWRVTLAPIDHPES